MWGNMFIGEYEHSIDNKKRIALPKKFRELLGSEVVITRGLDGCLFIYPMDKWRKLAKKLSEMPMGDFGVRSFVRLILSGAAGVEIDSQGRILIPDYLKKYAFLDKDVVIVGIFDRIEIWSRDKWSIYRDNAEKNSENIAQNLNSIGLF